MKRLTEGHAPTTPPQRRIECPVWHRPFGELTPQGIAYKCRSCGHGVIHIESWESVDQYRAGLEAMKAKES